MPLAKTRVVGAEEEEGNEAESAEAFVRWDERGVVVVVVAAGAEEAVLSAAPRGRDESGALILLLFERMNLYTPEEIKARALLREGARGGGGGPGARGAASEGG